MIATGLLWYDDDTRHTLAQKIAEGADRFRERIGYEPTACQLNPALIPAAPASGASSGSTRRSRIPAPTPSLRLLPDEHLRPNYFFIGVEAGDPAIPVPGWRGKDTGDEYDHASRTPSRSVKKAKSAKTAAAYRSSREAATQPASVEKPAKTATTSGFPLPTGLGAPPAAPVTTTKAAETATPAGSSSRRRLASRSVGVSGGRSHARVHTSVSDPRTKTEEPAESATSSPKSGEKPAESAPAKRTSAQAAVTARPNLASRRARPEKAAETATGASTTRKTAGTARKAAESATSNDAVSRRKLASVAAPAKTASQQGAMPARRAEKTAKSATAMPATAPVSVPSPRAAAKTATKTPALTGARSAPAPAAPTIARPHRGKNGNTQPPVLSAVLVSQTTPTRRRAVGAPPSTPPASMSTTRPAQVSLWADDTPTARPARKRRTA